MDQQGLRLTMARDTSFLQLHLPEGWPDPNRATVEFRYARFAAGAWVTGVAPLGAVPHGMTAVAVAPASAVLFARVALPKVRGAKLLRLLPLAVEDAIAANPEDVQVVLVEHVPEGSSLVAVVNKGWLAAALGDLATHGFRPARVIVETELSTQLAATEATRPWVLVRLASGGFACLGAGEIIALDLGEGAGGVPLALRLARNTHRRCGEAPAEILVFSGPGTDSADLEAWSRALDLPVRDGGEWRPDLIDARGRRATDLLRGDFSPAWGGRNLAPSLKVAAVAVASVLGLHTLLTIGNWWRLSSEALQVKSQMESEFRQIFPEAQAVVDAPLQLRRSLGRLRREGGVPDASDLIPLLAAVGPTLAAAGVHAERIRYEHGELQVEIAMPSDDGRAALEKQLRAPGYRVRVESLSDGTTGNVALVRVSAEA